MFLQHSSRDFSRCTQPTKYTPPTISNRSGMVVDHCDRHPRLFQNLDGRPYFSKCGLVSTRHISETVKDHIIPHALGMVRKLTSAELKEYVGGRKVMLDYQIFWKTLPEWSKDHPVYQVAVPRRLRSKTSFAVE